MLKCFTCQNHVVKGQKENIHSCKKCKTKKVIGQIQEQFIEYCTFYEMNEQEKDRQKLEQNLGGLIYSNSYDD